MATFDFDPSPYVPFRDKEALARCRAIKSEDINKHANPDLKIMVRSGEEIRLAFVTDMFYRIKSAADAGEKVVLILPNPAPLYREVAYMINKFRVPCQHVYGFAMDEYADQDGNIAPEDWRFGFIYAMYENFLYAIDEDLRPPKRQIIGPNNANINAYGKMLADMGGADVCYSGPGWTGHLAFVEPDAPEFDAPLEEWKQMGPRVCTLSPFTLAQNSLHGSFGMSGDIAAVPPKAATIGPAEVIGSKHRLDFHSLTVHGTATSWQRLITRLCLHGPVCPQLPGSIHQQLRTDCYVSHQSAQNIEPDWDKGY
jgi:glucosamine-6-phosphate deaminase